MSSIIYSKHSFKSYRTALTPNVNNMDPTGQGHYVMSLLRSQQLIFYHPESTRYVPVVIKSLTNYVYRARSTHNIADQDFDIKWQSTKYNFFIFYKIMISNFYEIITKSNLVDLSIRKTQLKELQFGFKNLITSRVQSSYFFNIIFKNKVQIKAFNAIQYPYATATIQCNIGFT